MCEIHEYNVLVQKGKERSYNLSIKQNEFLKKKLFELDTNIQTTRAINNCQKETKHVAREKNLEFKVQLDIISNNSKNAKNEILKTKMTMIKQETEIEK